MQLTLQNNRIKVKFNYDPKLIQFVKSIEGRQYSSPDKAWFIPKYISSGGLDTFRRLGFYIAPEVEKEVGNVQKIHEELADLKNKLDTDFVSSLPLYGYQKVGAAFLSHIGSGALCDQVGLGKTLMTLATIEKRGIKNNLIFCPKALTWQWAGEIEKFLPEKKVIVIQGNKDERNSLWQKEGADFYIANYELLLHDREAIISRQWGYAVADEATRLSNPYAKQTKAIGLIRSSFRLALTGTIISNRLEDVWSVINWTHPGALGSWYSFVEKYCLKNHWGSIVGYQNAEYIKKRIHKFMIRRTRDEVGLQLPEKTETEVPFDLGEKESELYEKIRKEALFDIEEAEISKVKNPELIQMGIVKLTRLRQLCDSMELLGKRRESAKLGVLQELLVSLLEDKRKIIIFTAFSQMADILERELSNYGVLKITGDVKKRQEIVTMFNQDVNKPILISTSAGQYGLNLQSASVVIHYDQCWSISQMEQRTGRAYRIGQVRNVLEYHLLARGTVDRYMRSIVKNKHKISEQFLTLAHIKEALIYHD